MSETTVTGPDLVDDGIPLDSLVLNEPVKGQFEGKQVIVVRTETGLCAVAGHCTHYGGPLGDGLCVDGQVHCPWHHATFDLSTGEAVGAPALNSLKFYQPTERDGRVFVTGPVDPPIVDRQPPIAPDSVVIVGSGGAGAAAAEMLRRLGYTGSVSMIGLEPPIDRPNVSKDYLAGTAPEDWMPLRSPDFYERHDITLITRVEGHRGRHRSANRRPRRRANHRIRGSSPRHRRRADTSAHTRDRSSPRPLSANTRGQSLDHRRPGGDRSRGCHRGRVHRIGSRGISASARGDSDRGCARGGAAGPDHR